MIGYFKVVKEDGQELARYKYATITAKQKAFLRGVKGIRCICCCNDQVELEIKISSDLKLYPASQDVGNLHDVRCPKYIDLKDQAWKTVQEGLGLYYHQAGTQVTADGYMRMANALTYERLTTPTLRLPDNFEQFNRRQHATLKYIQTPNGDRLYDISTTQNRNTERLETNKEYYFCGMLKAVKVTKFNPDIVYMDIEDCFAQRMRYYLEKDAYLEVRSKTLKNAPNLLVCGFAYKKSVKSKILTVSDIAMSSISNIGILA